VTGGLIIPLAEELIEDLGEEAALEFAQRIAARRLPGATFDGSARIIDAPLANPATGELLPPMRARVYRFRRA
jgi:hypothetical protein